MKIFFDTGPHQSTHQGRGIGTYTRNIIEALKKYPTVGVESGQVSSGGFTCDIIHYPSFDFFFHTLPIKKISKTVVTIHDTIPLIYWSQINPGLKAAARFYLQKLALLNVDAIITDSQNSKVDIEKFLSIPASKIHVTPLAVDDQFAKQAKVKSKVPKSLNLPKKYLLYVGDINYNKNVPALIRTFSSLSSDHHLLIVSRALKNTRIPESQRIIQAISHSSKKGKIRLLTDISIQYLPTIYAHADWYIQPSLYEGFGLPILEAYHSGVPVLCSNTSSLTEVAGSGALYFDPNSIGNMTQVMTNAMMLSMSERQNLIRQGQLQLEKFSWQQTAKLTLSVYQKILNHP